MKLAELKPGVYNLSRTVRNPRRDRRKTSDWREVAEFQVGERYIVTNSPAFGWEISPQEVRQYADRLVLTELDARAKALLEALEPAPVTVRSLICTVANRYESHAVEALQLLVNNGVLYLEDVKLALLAAREGNEQLPAWKRGAANPNPLIDVQVPLYDGEIL